MRTNGIDPATLQAALIGYEIQQETIEGRISEIRRQLGTRVTAKSTSATTGGPEPKRTMSAAARKRIAAAQRKRWRAYKKAKGAK